MRKQQLISGLCLVLLLGSHAAAQGGRRSGGPPPADAQQRTGQATQDAQLSEDMKREVERLVNQLDRLAAQGGGGGGRGARGGGPASPTFDPTTNDPMSGPVVANAPFSADAITTVTQVLGDGTRIDQRATAKFYRDGTGRMRREQTIVGMDWANPREPGEPISIITFDAEPGDPRPYQLDPAAKTARRVSRTAAASPGGLGVSLGVTLYFADNRVAWRDALNPANIDMPVNFQGLTIPRRGIPPDLRPTEEDLGTRQIEGLEATGTRTTVTIPTDRVGNDRPIQIADERWTSPELGLVVYSRFSDPRTGVVEYRLTNINRSEPPPDLFTVPSDYTVLGQPAGGQRSGGGGARGGGRGGAPQR